MLTLGRAPRYRAWVLRCWEVPGAAPGALAAWRCSLEDPRTRARRGFADLAALAVFLGAELAPGGDGPPGDGEEGGA